MTTSKPHPTNQDVYDLLVDIIHNRWIPISLGQEPKSVASLCQIADTINKSDGSCKGCPIFELDDKFEGCANTPFQDWLKAQAQNLNTHKMVAANKQAMFLNKVLDFYFGDKAAANRKTLIQKKMLKSEP